MELHGKNIVSVSVSFFSKLLCQNSISVVEKVIQTHPWVKPVA